jgi:electron transport complex protein RnfG
MTSDVSSTRLLASLGIAGALAGLLLVQVHTLTDPLIQQHKEERLQAAVLEVLPGAVRFETRWVLDGALTDALPEGADADTAERVHFGFGAEDQALGVALAAASQGYQDTIELIFGYDPRGDRLLGMKVLESKETPGLGDKIEKDAGWVAQFEGVTPPLEGVKPGRGSGAPTELDVITGATISSRTVVRAINEALERVGPALEGLP